MLLKGLCLCVTCASYVAATLPPASSKTTSPKKDLIKNEGFFFHGYALKLFPIVAPATAILQTIVYILFMISDKGFDQLQHLKTWHVLATLAALAGCALRRWSFATLDRFFTVRFSLESWHRFPVLDPA